MPGKILFKQGRHLTRKGMYFSYNYVQYARIRHTLCLALGVRLSHPDCQHLLIAIGSAALEETSKIDKDVTGRNSEAQLKSMTRIKNDTKLIEAVQNTDRKTFLMISDAQTDLIYEKIITTGYFIDSEGMQYTSTPSLDQYTHPGIEYYLPDGITGLRNAVSLALQRCIDNKEKRGRRKIKSRRLLADEVWRILRKYRPDASQTIWHWDKCNFALVFAHAVFKEVNPVINLDTLVKLMKERDYKKRSN